MSGLLKYGFTKPTQTANTIPTEEPETQKADYEKTKRQRKFRSEWKQEFKWLEYDTSKDVMYCGVCRQFPQLAEKSSSFFIGNNAFRKHHITIHGKSGQHLRCIAAHLAVTSPENTPMGRQIRQMESGQREKMIKIFNIAYYSVRNEIAFSAFPGLIDLHIKNGVDMVHGYANDKAIARWVGLILI